MAKVKMRAFSPRRRVISIKGIRTSRCVLEAEKRHFLGDIVRSVDGGIRRRRKPVEETGFREERFETRGL